MSNAGNKNQRENDIVRNPEAGDLIEQIISVIGQPIDNEAKREWLIEKLRTTQQQDFWLLSLADTSMEALIAHANTIAEIARTNYDFVAIYTFFNSEFHQIFRKTRNVWSEGSHWSAHWPTAHELNELIVH